VVTSAEHRRSTAGAGWRFLLVGGANTAITGLILIGLSYLMPGWLAYTIAFGLGIVFSTVFAARWVFTREGSFRDSVVYAICYGLIYLVGLVCVQVIRSWGWPEFLNVLSIVVTAPLGFIAGRVIFRQRQREDKTT
jgi:putative flippase GtrA